MTRPALEVGGDFYDNFMIDDDHLALVIADVSRKGVPAALFMMVSKLILQSCAMLGLSPAEILTAFRSGYGLLRNGARFVEFRVPQDGTYSYTSLEGHGSVLDVRWRTNRQRFHALLDTDPEETNR